MFKDFQADASSDVSLITGKVRNLGAAAADGDDNEDSSGALAAQETAVGLLHQGGGGEFLSGRGWQGLEQKLGETPVTKAERGRAGIAGGYQGEGQQQED